MRRRSFFVIIAIFEKTALILCKGTGSGLEVHHLIEQRFANTLGVDPNSIPSIVLTHEEHLKFTNAWSKQIGKNGSHSLITTDSATPEDVVRAAKEIYADYPEILKALKALNLL